MNKQKRFIELMLLSSTAKRVEDTKIEIDYSKPMSKEQILFNFIALFIVIPVMVILTITLTKRYEYQLEKDRLELIHERRK